MFQPIIILGPDKTGTTWLYEQLKHSFDLAVPYKDINFFNKYWSRGTDWYESEFGKRGNGKPIDISHEYIESIQNLVRIKLSYPNAQIVLIYRDPVDRTLSAFNYSKNTGAVPRDLWKAVKTRPSLISNSLLSVTYKAAISLFGDDQVKILTFEDLKQNPQKFLNEFCDFVGVNRITSAENVQRNAMPSGAFRNITPVLRCLAPIMRTLGANRAVNLIKMSSKIRHLFFGAGGWNFEEVISQDDRQRLEQLLSNEQKALHKILKKNTARREK